MFTLNWGVVDAGKVVCFKTGISAKPPDGHYLRVTGRSGLSAKGIVVLTGVVDPDYTGDIQIMVHNTTEQVFHVPAGYKIAQMIPERYASECQVQVISSLPSGARGSKGFGSSGY